VHLTQLLLLLLLLLLTSKLDHHLLILGAFGRLLVALPLLTAAFSRGAPRTSTCRSMNGPQCPACTMSKTTPSTARRQRFV
jgi:hypothetical protein